MDPITHILFGYLIGVLFVHLFSLHKVRRIIILTSIIASLFPDIDFFLPLFSQGVYLVYHRFLNSVFLIVPGCMLITFVISKIFKKKFGKKISVKKYVMQKAKGQKLKAMGKMQNIKVELKKYVFDIALWSYVVHIFLDWVGSWGTLFWFPFSIHRSYLDLAPIFDIYIVIPLLLFLILSLFVRVIFKKFYIKFQNKNKTHWRIESMAAKIILILLFVHFGFKGYIHSNAVDIAEYNGFENTMAIPDFVNPFSWLIIGQNETDFRVSTLNLLDREFTQNQTYSKQHLELAKELSKTNKELKYFLDFARAPYVEYLDNADRNSQEKLIITDLRFKDMNRFSKNRGSFGFVKDSNQEMNQNSFGDPYKHFSIIVEIS